MRRALLTLTALLAATSAQAADITVCASGCDHTTIQAAVNAAVDGDRVLIRAGETFVENVSLPDKGTLTVPIIIRSDAADGEFPDANTRIPKTYVDSGDYLVDMPLITGPTGGLPVIRTANGASDYVLRFLAIGPTEGGYNQVVRLGDTTSGQQFESQQAENIQVDRVVIRGGQWTGQKTGIQLNGRNLSIINSYIDRITAQGQDAVGVGCINGTGPLIVMNNYIEAAAENMLCGGDDPQMRTTAEVNAGATTTQATLSNLRADHTIATLKVGQLIAFLTNGGTQRQHTYVRSCGATTPGDACSSNTITYDTIAIAPDTGVGTSDARWGAILDNILVRRNYFAKNVAWMNPIIATPANLTIAAQTGTGSLAAGTYYYRIVAENEDGYNGVSQLSTPTAELSATLTATGQVVLSWASVPGATRYRVYGRISGGTTGYLATTSTTLTDTGTALTSATSLPGGNRWVVKNLFEIKHGTNWQIDSNIFEYHWTGSDSGLAIWIKSANGSGFAEFAQTKNVVFERNIIRNISGGFNIQARNLLGADAPAPLENVTIRNNLLHSSNSTWAYGYNSLTQWIVKNPHTITVSNDSRNVTFDHNTILDNTTSGSGIYFTSSRTQTNFRFTNNLIRAKNYGINCVPIGGVSYARGTECFEAHAPDGSFAGNAMAGASASVYPTGNEYPTNADFESHFIQYATGGTGASANYGLNADSSYIDAGTDGDDIGANIADVLAATAGVEVGTTGTAPPNPVTITTVGELTQATQSVAYTAQLNATGGTTPYVWTNNAAGTTLNDADAQCAGLTVSTAGVVSGTPTQTGVCSWTAKVTDDVSQTDTQALDITIVSAVSTLTITTTSPMANAVTGSPYSVTLAATGGTEPYTWTNNGAGTSLNDADDECDGLTVSTDGVVSGPTTAAGVCDWTALVTDAGGVTDTQAFTITSAVETLPCGRNRADAGQETRWWRRSTPPPAECVLTGDGWIDTSTTPPTLKLAAVPGEEPTWEIQSATTIFDPIGTPAEGDLIVGREDGSWVKLPLGDDGMMVCSSGGALGFCLPPSVSIPTPFYTVTIRADNNAWSPGATNIDGTDVLEFGGSSGYTRVQVDLTNATQMRVQVQITTNTGTTSYIRVEYSTDYGATWTSTPIIVATAGDSNRMRVGTWTDIPSGMRGDVTLRLRVLGGNGTENPSFGNTAVSYR